jgi:hypothetical protein
VSAPDLNDGETGSANIDPSDDETQSGDLGFGTVVSEESQARLLNRDGTFNEVRPKSWTELTP